MPWDPLVSYMWLVSRGVFVFDKKERWCTCTCLCYMHVCGCAIVQSTVGSLVERLVIRGVPNLIFVVTQRLDWVLPRWPAALQESPLYFGTTEIRLGTPLMTSRSTREPTVLWNHRDQIGYSPDDQPLYKRAHCTLDNGTSTHMHITQACIGPFNLLTHGSLQRGRDHSHWGAQHLCSM